VPPAPTTILDLDPNRLSPVDERVRAVARGLYDLIVDKPILSPHCHVNPRLLVEDAGFADPAELLIRHDHYFTRVLHSDVLQKTWMPGYRQQECRTSTIRLPPHSAWLPASRRPCARRD